MIRIFAGSDSATSYAAAKQKALELTASRGWQLQVVDADELSAQRLLELTQSAGLFSAGNVVLAKRLFAHKDATDLLDTLLPQADSVELIVWHDANLDGRTSVVKRLKQAKLVKEFTVLKTWEVEEWLKTKLRKLVVAKDISEATKLLLAVSTADLGRLQQELSKLELIASAAGVPLGLAMVTKLASGDIQGSIWDYLDCLSSGNKAGAVSELRRLLGGVESEQYLIAMLARQLDLLAKVLTAKQIGLGNQIPGVHSFVLSKLQAVAHKYSWQQLVKLTQALLRLDTSIKRGNLDARVGLLLFTLSW